MASIKETVKSYIADKWPVVPIMRGKKRPEDTDWVKKTYSEDDFTEEHNIGVKLGSGLADIDLDCTEAVRAAGLLMPETKVHGRPGKPASHYWFKCGTEPFQYKDLDGSMLMEIRSASNLQTVVPPSIWTSPDGTRTEQLRWETTVPPMEIQRDDLLLAVRATAIATLFGRHWPTGSRHVASGHLAGFLLRLGFDGPWTTQIVKTAATIAGDEEVDDRARMAKDTVSKHLSGAKTTGAPKLTESFANAEQLVERCYLWMQREGDAKLDTLNEQHFVAHYGGDTIVATPVRREFRDAKDEAATSIQVHTFEEFRRRYYNQRVGKSRLGEWWLSHPKQRRYRDIVFAPPPRFCHPENYNLWQGFTCDPDPNPNPEQRCGRFLTHLYEVICDGNETNYNYALDFLALTCQVPGLPIERAFIMQGDSGAGKGTLVKLFWQIFHPDHCMQLAGAEPIVGRFNAGLSGKIIVFADEAIWGGNRSQAGALRRLVTEHSLAIERKGIDIVTEPNCVHLFMASNEEWVWPAVIKERRGFLLQVRLKTFQTDAYFSALHQEWETGGREAFLALALGRHVPGNRMGPIPTTTNIASQQQHSLDVLHQWWLDRLSRGFLQVDAWDGFVPTKWLVDDLYAYARSRQMRGERVSEVQFGMQFPLFANVKRTRKIADVNIMPFGEQPMIQRRQTWGFVIPQLQEARDRFDQYTGTKHDWPPIDEGTPLPYEDDDAKF